MKKVLILLLLFFSGFFGYQQINAQNAERIVFQVTGFDPGLVSVNLSDLNQPNIGDLEFAWEIPLAGNFQWRLDNNQNVFIANASNVFKYDISGEIIWNVSSPSISTARASIVDSNGDFYVSTFANQLYKIDGNNGNVLFNVQIINSGITHAVTSIAENTNNGNIYIGTDFFIAGMIINPNNGSIIAVSNAGTGGGSSSTNTNEIVYDPITDQVFASNANHRWFRLNPNNLNQSQMVQYPSTITGLNVYQNEVCFFSQQAGFTNSRIECRDVNGSYLRTDSRDLGGFKMTRNFDGTFYLWTGNTNNVFSARGLVIISSDFSTASIIVEDPNTTRRPTGINIELAQTPILQVEYPLFINLDSNYNPFADIQYQSNFLTTTSSIVNDILTTDSAITVSSIQSNISPFEFLHWWDLDNNVVFSANREFVITSPLRSYNLRAIYQLNNSINLNMDSNLPSPPNFIIEVDTIEGERAFINQYPLINEEIPFGYNFVINAPIDNVGVYEFDFWYDNLNNQVFTTSAIVSLNAVENYNLTAVYSLPTEYQINLTISVPIGFIIFQHGNLPPVSGPFISAVVGVGDSWTAIAPLTSDYRFLQWFDWDNQSSITNNRTINITTTNRNYLLVGEYQELATIFWDTQGGTVINPFKVDLPSIFNSPPLDPIRPNFVFGGWAVPSSPNTAISFPQNITQNITYQAIWLPTFNLTFNTNGGQIIPTQTIIENNTPTAVTPSRFGYTFDGWYTDNVTFNNEFDFNDPFTSNTTIHAKWIFGTTANAETSLQSFLGEARLDNPIAQWILVLSLFILLNVMIFIYKGPFIVTVILNFILTALFIVFGFIPIWITIVLFMAIFGFMILMLSGGRS